MKPLFSKSRKTGTLMFLSGQVGSIVANDELQLVEGGLKGQLEQALVNVRAILKGEGLDLPDIIDVSIFLTNMDDYSEMNRLYSLAFKDPYPSRTCVAVAELPLGALIELKVIAEWKK